MSVSNAQCGIRGPAANASADIVRNAVRPLILIAMSGLPDNVRSTPASGVLPVAAKKETNGVIA